MTSLDIAGNKITAKQTAEKLANAVLCCKALLTADCSRNVLRDAFGVALGEGMRLPTVALTSLDLSDCSIGDAGVAAISRGLHENQSITSLNLSSNKFGDRGSEALGHALEVNKTLKTLVLDKNTLGERGGRAILKASMLPPSPSPIASPIGSPSPSSRLALALALALAYVSPHPVPPALYLLLHSVYLHV